MTKAREDEAMKTGILLALLRDAPFDGWSDATLRQAAAKANAAQHLSRLFPRGAADAARFFSGWADAEMLKKIPAKKLKDMRVRDRVTAGVRARLEALKAHKQALGAALGFMAAPPRNLALPAMVWATSDKIWRAAGDTATDYNHYTKRILLAGVITATTLYWLNDKSEGHEDTWAFLDRRIENVLKAGQALGKLRRKKESA